MLEMNKKLENVNRGNYLVIAAKSVCKVYKRSLYTLVQLEAIPLHSERSYRSSHVSSLCGLFVLVTQGLGANRPPAASRELFFAEMTFWTQTQPQAYKSRGWSGLIPVISTSLTTQLFKKYEVRHCRPSFLHCRCQRSE